MRNLFRLKCNNPHPVCKVYFGKYSCGQTYIDETVKNVEVKWMEHNSCTGNSEPPKHLQENNQHIFTWKVFMAALQNNREHKNVQFHYMRQSVLHSYGKITKFPNKPINPFPWGVNGLRQVIIVVMAM